jgi:CHAT domain-containing protein
VRLVLRVFVVVVLMAATGWSGCHSSPQPEVLIAEAEALRNQYEKEASQQAIAKYQQAMTGWKRLGREREAARTAQQIGATYEQLGSLHYASRSYDTALSLARELANHLLESEIRSDIGIVQALLADREEAFENAERQCEIAHELARKVGSEAAAAKALNCLGEAAYYRERPEQALEFYRKAGHVWDRLGDRRGQAQTLLYQGSVHSDFSNFDEARKSYSRAQALRTSLGDKRDLAIILVADARLQGRRGEYQLALNKFDEALALLRRMGDVVWEASCLTGIARVYLDMGDTAAALEYRERALQLFEQAGLKTATVEALISLGDTYLAAGHDAKALDRFQRALTLAEERGIHRSRSLALRNIGVVHLFRRLAHKAQQYLESSLEAQRSVRTPSLEARTRADLGETHVLLGEHALAAKYFEDALTLGRAGADRVVEARSLFGLARASSGLNDLDAARKYIDRSWRVAESIRTTVESRDLRASYFASVHRYNEFYVDLLMRQHKVHPRRGLAAEAFEAAERARARSLLESLTEARIDLRKTVDADLLKREQALNKAFDDWAAGQRRLSGAAREAQRASIADEYRDLELRHNQLQAEIRSKNPRYAALVRPQPLTLKEVQHEVLDADTLLLEYALGEERSFLWAVSKKDYTSYELPPREAIEQAAQRVYEQLTARLTMTGDAADVRRRVEQADLDYWKEAARLSNMLLGPVAKRLAGKTIVVVADGMLQYLPFAALPIPATPGRPVPMIEKHAIISLPSASVLAILRRETRDRKPAAGAVAVVADPVFEATDPRLRTARRIPSDVVASAAPVTPAVRATGGLSSSGTPWNNAVSIGRLSWTREEADAIVAAAPEGMTLRAVDFDANRAMAMSPDLARYRIVHFATHSIFDNEDPSRAGIVLSMFDRQGKAQDGFLRLHDIYRLDLPAELVVLSACNTALGKPVKGEGLVGMVRGFMYAGAKRVVASVWNVEDEATGALMTRFYQEMLKENQSPAAALRRAQLAIRQHDKWQAPFYWAAFVLQGEWR